jgi:hypothetical protein
MKVSSTILMVGVFCSFQAVVSAQSTNLDVSATPPKAQATPESKAESTSASKAELASTTKPEPTDTTKAEISSTSKEEPTSTFSKPQMRPVYPVTQYKLQVTKPGSEAPATTDKIVRYGNTQSSQAWSTIAAHQGNPTVYHDLSTHEPQISILTFTFGNKNGNEVRLGK